MNSRHLTLKKLRFTLFVALCGVILTATGAGLCDGAGAGPGRPVRVVDMAGQNILLSEKPRRVVTVRGAPILNTFIFALGRGDTIVNGLPVSARLNQKDCCRFQNVFAPQLDGQPSIEGKDSVKIEALLLLKPDLVLTTMKKYIKALPNTGIPVICVETGHDGNKNKDIMTILGKALGAQSEAQKYVRYFDLTIRRVRSKTSDIPGKKKAKVLYCNFKTFTQSSPTADWWIETAGGVSLGKNGPVLDGIRGFSAEDVITWDPDVFIVSTPGEIDMVYGDPRFRQVTAVKRKRVFSVPTGSLRWSHPTSEQPLAVLWAAKIFYPERFEDLDLKKETREFYKTFFKYRLTDKQIAEILTGK